ncbi:MAG TPA: HTTM domain-containing protein [Kofleriaceae bacterium]|nr:HTTM domain-containing protein [Kofleriaceae bacterium]
MRGLTLLGRAARGLPANLGRAVFAPRPIERLAAARVLASLAILGFMSSRIAHADDWLSDAGFHVPAVSGWQQPLTLPALPVWLAWTVAIALAASGLATAAGALTRVSSAVFAALLAYVALADRLAAFTVSKLAPVIALALCLSPSGARYSVDAWRRARRRHSAPDAPRPTHVSGGCVAFFQILLPVFYVSSGWCKARHDWLSEPHVLWTHLHDSYQTTISWLLANHLPPWMWTAFQGAVLLFECGAPLWFALRPTRPYALGFGVAMHLMIGVMFGPVIWFSLLMTSLLVASYAPEPWLARAFTGMRRT